MARVSHTRRRVLGWLALAGATACWAGNFVLGEVAVGEMSPVSLTWLRWIGALAPLFLLAQLIERPDWRTVWRHLPWYALMGLVGAASYNVLLYLSLEHATAFDSALINAFNPAIIAIGAVLFLGERLGIRQIAGILVALAGVVWLVTGGAPARILSQPLGAGALFMLGATVVWSAYTLLGRVGPKDPPIAGVALQATCVVVALAPVALAQGVDLPQSGAGWGSLAYIALFPSVGSYVLWNMGLRVIPPAQAGVSLNLITVFTAVITAALGAVILPAQLVGGALVLGGVLLTAGRARPASR